MNHTIYAIERLIYTFVIVGICLFYALPAEAELTRKQVKKIATKVVIQHTQGLTGVPGPQGLRGPVGPAGPPGGGSGGLLYAHVDATGEVDASRSAGVTSSDVSRIINDDPFSRILPSALNDAYCFKIPANGAQVTVDTADSIAGLQAEVNFHEGIQAEYGCDFIVTFTDRDGRLQTAGFYILIY